MEVQSSQPPAFPSWVMMGQKIYSKDPSSFRADDETYAEIRASNGEPIRLSFILHALPGLSRLCLHTRPEREPSSLDTVVAAHGNAVLFRLEVDFERGSVLHYTTDYFIYRAYSSGPELSLLPRCCPTEAETIAAAVEGSPINHWRILRPASIGILLAGEAFVVAELRLEYVEYVDDLDTPLEAELFRLHSHGAATDGQWELKRPRCLDGKVKLRDVLWWDTHKVVPFGSYLCWVDYFRGVLFCDVYHESPELQYLPLPVDNVPHGNPGKGSPGVSRTVCITKVETMKFVNVVRSNGALSGPCKPGAGFTINIWTLRLKGYKDMEWVKDVAIEADELWAMEGYDHNQLPRFAPQLPLVSMDDPRILYFVLRKGGPNPDANADTWIVMLDMESKTILSYRNLKALHSEEEDGRMVSYSILGSDGFFTSEFSKYLNKPASRQWNFSFHLRCTAPAASCTSSASRWSRHARRRRRLVLHVLLLFLIFLSFFLFNFFSAMIICCELG